MEERENQAESFLDTLLGGPEEETEAKALDRLLKLDLPEGQPRPLAIVAEYTRRYPRAAKQAQTYRENRGSGRTPNWPEWCFLPYEFVQGLVLAEHGKRYIDDERILDAPILGTLIPWRLTKGIYRVDPDVLQILWHTPLTGDIPTVVLRHLPEWCCYIELPPVAPQTAFDPPSGGKVTRGFFVQVVWDIRHHHAELWIVLDTEDGLFPSYLNLKASTVEDCWLSTERESLLFSGVPEEEVESLLSSEDAKQAAAVVSKHFSAYINVALYLCSDEPEIFAASGARDDQRPGNPKPRRTKKRDQKLFAAQGVREWNVAWRMGAALRRAKEDGENDNEGDGGGARKRPHIRRAHWHSFWRGSRDPKRADERHLTVKWIPPLAINVDAVDELPAVVRRVG